MQFACFIADFRRIATRSLLKGRSKSELSFTNLWALFAKHFQDDKNEERAAQTSSKKEIKQ